MSITSQEYLHYALAEKARLESLGRTGGGQYQSCLRHVEAAQMINADPTLAEIPRRADETDICSWGVRVLSPAAVAIRKARTQ